MRTYANREKGDSLQCECWHKFLIEKLNVHKLLRKITRLCSTNYLSCLRKVLKDYTLSEEKKSAKNEEFFCQ